MGLNVKSESVSAGVTVWSRVDETATGGFTLDKTGLTNGDVIPAGQPMGFDESTRVAKVIKTAILHADATNSATDYQVKKGHNFVIGEYLVSVIGGKSYAISAIDTSNAGYDILTVGTTLGVALTAGHTLFQGASSGASAGAFYVTPKGCLYEPCVVDTNQSVSVVLRGTMYARRVPVNNTAIVSALPSIIFSQSY